MTRTATEDAIAYIEDALKKRRRHVNAGPYGKVDRPAGEDILDAMEQFYRGTANVFVRGIDALANQDDLPLELVPHYMWGAVDDRGRAVPEEDQETGLLGWPLPEGLLLTETLGLQSDPMTEQALWMMIGMRGGATLRIRRGTQKARVRLPAGARSQKSAGPRVTIKPGRGGAASRGVVDTRVYKGVRQELRPSRGGLGRNRWHNAPASSWTR